MANKHVCCCHGRQPPLKKGEFGYIFLDNGLEYSVIKDRKISKDEKRVFLANLRKAHEFLKSEDPVEFHKKEYPIVKQIMAKSAEVAADEALSDIRHLFEEVPRPRKRDYPFQGVTDLSQAELELKRLAQDLEYFNENVPRKN